MAASADDIINGTDSSATAQKADSVITVPQDAKAKLNPWQAMGAGLQMQANNLQQNYYNAWLMTQHDLAPDQEKDLLQKATVQNYGDLTPEEMQAQPWWVRGAIDAEGIGASLWNAYAAGGASGLATAGAATPISKALSYVPEIGPALAVGALGFNYSTGFTVGSLAALGTQSAGQMYGDLRLRDVSQDTARKVAGAYGLFSAGLGSLGLTSAQSLAGKARLLTLRTGLIDAFQVGDNAAVKKVQDTLVSRLALEFAHNTAVNTSVAEGQILLNHAARAVAGYLEKNNLSQYTNWGELGKDTTSQFLELLLAGALVSTHTVAVGAASGAVKTSIDKLLTPENVKLLEDNLKNTSPTDVLQRIEQAANEKPFPFEENPTGQIAHTEDGRILQLPEQSSASTDAASAAPPGTLQGHVEQNVQAAQTQVNPPSEVAHIISAVTGDHPHDVQAGIDIAAQMLQNTEVDPSLSGTPLGQVQKEGAYSQSTPEVSQALNAMFAPQEDQFVPAQTQGREVGANVDMPAELTPEETQARINQVAADTRLLNIEQRRLEQQFNRKEKLGHSTNATLTKLEQILNAKDELQLERDMLEQGLLTRQEVSQETGQQRMKTLAKIMERLQKSNAKLITQKQKYESRVLDAGQQGMQKGMNAERRSIRTMQKQLTQYINGATKDRTIRTQLYKLVNGVTTQEQFVKAGNELRDKLVALESEKVANQYKANREKIIGQIDKLVARGAKVKHQSGHPVSDLTADTVKSMQLLRDLLHDQTLPEGQRKQLTEKTLEAFAETRLNPEDDSSPTYGELMAEGQPNLIPFEDLMKYEMATLAYNIQHGGLIGAAVAKGNIAQIIQDARDVVAQKHAEVSAQREHENQIAETAAKADTHERIEGNTPPGVKNKQRLHSTHATLLTWDSLQDYIDPSGQMKLLVDVTPAKRLYLLNKEVTVGALRQQLQNALVQAGSNKDITKYMTEASTEEYEFRYPRTDGKVGTARYTRAQMVDIAAYMRDSDNWPTLRDSKKGNNLTLTGDVAPGTSFQELMYRTMTPEDHVVANALVDFLVSYGQNSINPWYRDKYGVDLPMSPNYWPRNRDVQRTDMGQKRRQMFASLLPKSSKTRVKSLRRFNFLNAFDRIDDHIEDWEHAKAYDPVFGTMQNVFKRNEQVRTAISDRFGKGTMAVIDNYMDRFVDNTPMPSGENDWFWLALRGSMARAVLPWRAPVQMLQQMSAGYAMWKEHSLPEIVAGVGQTLANIPETERVFRSSPILRHRFEGGASFDLYTALHQAGLVESTIWKLTGLDGAITPEQHSALLRLGFEGIRRGDAATVRLFGAPVYWAEIARGKTSEEALMTVERLADATQQGDSVDQIPYIYAKHPVLYTLVGQFHLQPLQLYAHEAAAVRAFAENPTFGNGMKLAKQTAVLWLLPGLFYGAVQNAPGLFYNPSNSGYDINQRYKEEGAGGVLMDALHNQNVVAMASEGILGPVNGIPLVGDIIESAWFASMKPLIGTDMGYRVDVGGNTVADRANSFMEMIQAWHQVAKSDDATKLPPISSIGKDDKVFKAIFKTARTIGPLTGTPNQLINGPAGVANALRHDDWIGAMFATGGWSPGSIQVRYKSEDSIALPKFAPEKPTAADWIRDGILKGQVEYNTSQQNVNNPDDSIVNGIINATPEEQNPATMPSQ